jgi:hypothetical protein
MKRRLKMSLVATPAAYPRNMDSDQDMLALSRSRSYVKPSGNRIKWKRTPAIQRLEAGAIANVNGIDMAEALHWAIFPERVGRFPRITSSIEHTASLGT